MTFTVCRVPCLLVQLVPNAFIVRMTRALDGLTESHDDAPLGDALRDVRVRVWAELGRARMPSGRLVALPSGAVVELDRAVEAPIDLYADGMCFATGRLLVDRRRRPGRAHRDGPRRDRFSFPDPCSARSPHAYGGCSLMARVLVVDDAAFMRKMVSDALTGGGHEVVGEAGNGAEAVQRFPGAAPRHHDARHHHAREGRPGRPEGDHRRRSRRARGHVLGAGPGVQGARVDQARRQGLRRQALPGRSRPVGRGEGAGLVPAP